MEVTEKRLEFASDLETRARWAAVVRLLEIVEPDADYRPWFISDEASLFDCTGYEEHEILAALRQEFGAGFLVQIGQPIWKVVDDIRRSFPAWPD